MDWRPSARRRQNGEAVYFPEKRWSASRLGERKGAGRRYPPTRKFQKSHLPNLPVQVVGAMVWVGGFTRAKQAKRGDPRSLLRAESRKGVLVWGRHHVHFVFR